MSTNLSSFFFFPTKIVSGKKTLEVIPYELDRSGNVKRPLIVAYKRNNLIKHLKNAFAESGIITTVISLENESVETLETANAVAALYREHNCDSLIACGNTGIVNLSKVVNILVSGGIDLDEFDSGNVTIALKPLIFVPTSFDIGNGLTNTAAITDGNGKTFNFKSRFLFPKVAIIDPRMVESQSKDFLVVEGLKAMFLAINYVITDTTSLYSKGYAETATKIIYNNLMNAVKGRKNSIFALINASCMLEAVMVNNPQNNVFKRLNDLFEQAFVYLFPYYLEIYIRSREKDLTNVLRLMGEVETSSNLTIEQQGKRVLDLLKELQGNLDVRSEEEVLKKLAIKIDSEDFKALMQKIVDKSY